MKRLVVSLAVLIAATATGLAADLPESRETAPPAPALVHPLFSWSGFYLGVHGAWLRDEGEAVRTRVSGVSLDALPTRLGLSDRGLGGGAQIGYLWDLGSLVVGLEADITAMDVGRSRSFEGTDGTFALRTELSSQMRWFGSVKGRLGLSLPSLVPFIDRSLVYVTGGVAFAENERDGRITVVPSGLGPQTSREEWTTGFVIGGGTEHMLTESVSLKSETLYYDLADEKLTLARAGNEAVYRFKSNGWVSRVGINVRF